MSTDRRDLPYVRGFILGPEGSVAPDSRALPDSYVMHKLANGMELFTEAGHTIASGGGWRFLAIFNHDFRPGV